MAVAQSRPGLGVVVNLQANEATHYWTPRRALSASTDAPQFAGLPGPRRRGRARLRPALASDAPRARTRQRAAAAMRVRDVEPTCREALSRPPPGRPRPRSTLVATGACGSMVSGPRGARSGAARAARAAALHLPLLRTLPVQPPGRALDARAGLSVAERRALARLGAVRSTRRSPPCAPAWRSTGIPSEDAKRDAYADHRTPDEAIFRRRTRTGASSIAISIR